VNNTLWYCEEIPGEIHAADVTQQLVRYGSPATDDLVFLAKQQVNFSMRWIRCMLALFCLYSQERGYWPSYNVPYFDDVYVKSGYKDALKYWTKRSEGNPLAMHNLAELGYQTAPRANIFRRDQGSVDDIDGMKWIMRENNYKTDPYSKGSPWNAICSRGDLAGTPMGCYDGKITSFDLIPNRQAWVVNGPTTSQGTLPPFSWTGQFANAPHEGMPTTYNFTFELTQPNPSV